MSSKNCFFLINLIYEDFTSPSIWFGSVTVHALIYLIRQIRHIKKTRLHKKLYSKLFKKEITIYLQVERLTPK